MTQEAKRAPLYLQIRDYILEHIHQNKWQANDRLPTEAVLADQFGVSRFTVKNALSELVKEGLIYRIQGKGSFISPTVTEHEDHSLPQERTVGAFRPIVFLTPSIQSTLSSNILAGVEEVLSDHGYQIVYRSTRNDQEIERQALQECVRMGARGVMIFPVDGESYSEDILRLTLNKFPVVVIDRYLRGVDTNCVCSDNAGGAFDATSHLIELGHSNIAFVALHNRTTTSLEDRLTGFEKALTKHHIPVDHRRCLFELLAEHPPKAEKCDAIRDAKSLALSFLDRNPDVTAVFAATTGSGLAVMEAAEELGIRVPEQLSVIFFDDYKHSALSRIPPSCVVQQEKEIGAEAAKLLLSVIENPLQERRQLTLPTRLVLRNSTAEARK
ncbi:GntR family transcriptional regulator [Paenibacillus sp. N3.4]|uniref:GntR family transcriptional regulator n=1 Tax=Paenibacillus sp. N3.4 TaxID=2603222 RepID=UPI0011C9D38B|nr:GntR family transcriptional regulator [Paenibacillus sp. N3.4]TXK84459.1 GntR family transcriptional regulator [Paenibacillus sp. N3.4]